MLTVSKPASLVQQKKEQWAREREEMSHLYLPWGSGNSRSGDRLQVRNQFASTLELHKQSSYDYQEPIQRQRSPSLPPIRNCPEQQTFLKDDVRRAKDTINRNLSSAKRFAFYDEDAEGDTSGYGSETLNVSIMRNGGGPSLGNNPVVAWHQEHAGDRSKHINEENTNECVWSARSPRSLTNEEGRPRWGDRGVATGRLWEPTAPTARLPQMPNQKKGTPSWVERGLNMIDNTAEVLEIDQRSSNSGVDCDRSSNGSEEGRTFLRGQNVPLEPEIKAQREHKRIKALELQSAILSQLEDQEKRKREERERKRMDEKLEELRIQREREEDRLRLQQEKRKIEEKQLLEQQKLESLKKALEDAEKKAKQEKEKRFNRNRYNSNDTININSQSRPDSILNIPDADTQINMINNNNVSVNNRDDSPSNSTRTYDLNSANCKQTKNKDASSQQPTEFNSPRSVGTGNLNFYIQNVPPLSFKENQYSIVPLGVNGDLINNQQTGIQLAVLVPQNTNSSLYSVSLNSLNNIQDCLENTTRLLTPKKFRNAKYRDVSTQTEPILIKYVDKTIETEEFDKIMNSNYENLPEILSKDSQHNTLKKDRRFHSEERYKKEIQNRPKWGVNRPAAQYKKQSEKDPFFGQRRKMRQKHRPPLRQYLSQSSDDSRSPSPPLRSEKLNKQRNSLSQSYWQNKRNSHDFIKSNSDVAEDTTSQLDFNNISDVTSNDKEPKKVPDNIKISPRKRFTLTQKFINDKYGNRRLWNDDIITDKTIKSHSLDIDNRKKIIDQLNLTKRDYFENIDDHDHVVMKTKL